MMYSWVVTTKVAVFLGVMSCSIADRYQHTGGKFGRDVLVFWRKLFPPFSG